MKLLSIDTNAKTSKNTEYGYLTGILYLAPYKLSGVNLCPMAEKAGCVNGCLYTAGRGVFNNVQQARLNRSKLFNSDQNAFMRQLVDEIGELSRKAKKLGIKAAVRLNGTSDIQWEKIKFKWFNKDQTIFDIFPNVQFYDYTKIPNRSNLPDNYDLTFSYSGAAGFDK